LLLFLLFLFFIFYFLFFILFCFVFLDSWFKCDDDEVIPVTTEDILKLAGGGDWHCAYLLFYGPRVLEVEEAPDQKIDVTLT